MKRENDDIEIVDVDERYAWRKWLVQKHNFSRGAWLIIQKKGSDNKGVSLEDAVEEALCFGWIDSRLNVIDTKSFKLLFTPRKPRSVWSKINKQRAEKLIRKGLMTSVGLKKIEEAKRDGSWNSLDTIEELQLPEDLREAPITNKNAQQHFKFFNASTKKQILWWIKSAKTPETRLKRIRQTISIAEKNKSNSFNE